MNEPISTSTNLKQPDNSLDTEVNEFIQKFNEIIENSKNDATGKIAAWVHKYKPYADELILIGTNGSKIELARLTAKMQLLQIDVMGIKLEVAALNRYCTAIREYQNACTTIESAIKGLEDHKLYEFAEKAKRVFSFKGETTNTDSSN